ncbi:hypothetical protein PGTUg99_011394 [Puccinia graminis f. sp. tritici]|uniref:Uncharacterized protein n=1 Tax=Puccinia graminis f. sp. tritici TaxID=56615 RepID=A0A5B0S3C3_PUCGR|nr:hypothetical protein PGTUg99_011394 [Puccinia graminis f. sp. tritici]
MDRLSPRSFIFRHCRQDWFQVLGSLSAGSLFRHLVEVELSLTLVWRLSSSGHDPGFAVGRLRWKLAKLKRGTFNFVRGNVFDFLFRLITSS